MKKFLSVLLCAVLLVGCGGTATDSTSSAASEVESDTTVPSEAASSEEASSEETAEVQTVDLDAIVTALEAVNPIANPRVLDDFSVENDMLLTMDNLVAYKGDVTNDQADCGLVFAAQAKDAAAAETVAAELQAYKDSLSANDLYAEFADKIALAKEARIVTKDNVVVMVIASLNGPDYADIDAAIDAAF